MFTKSDKNIGFSKVFKPSGAQIDPKIDPKMRSNMASKMASKRGAKLGAKVAIPLQRGA